MSAITTPASFLYGSGPQSLAQCHARFVEKWRQITPAPCHDITFSLLAFQELAESAREMPLTPSGSARIWKAIICHVDAASRGDPKVNASLSMLTGLDRATLTKILRDAPRSFQIPLLPAASPGRPRMDLPLLPVASPGRPRVDLSQSSSLHWQDSIDRWDADDNLGDTAANGVALGDADDNLGDTAANGVALGDADDNLGDTVANGVALGDAVDNGSLGDVDIGDDRESSDLSDPPVEFRVFTSELRSSKPKKRR